MTTLNESLTLVVESGDDTATSDEFPIQLITPGWGSSGYYSEQVLENAVSDRIWPKGTHIYFDHPGVSEQMDRPVRSVRDLAAVLSEDAYSAGNGVIRGKAKPIGPYKGLLLDTTFQEAVGMSIRADGDLTEGEAAGRRGPIVTRLTSSQSVDIVSKPGRGGRILPLMESAGMTPARAVEATTEDERARLELGLREALGDRDHYLVDFDTETRTAYYRVYGEDSGLWARGYTLTPNGATLADAKTKVRAVTTYVSLDQGEDVVVESSGAPAGHTDTQLSEEDKQMTIKQIEEAELSQLQEAASKLEESERRTTAAETRASAAELRSSALTAIMESGHRFNKLEVSGLLADLPVSESGVLDSEKFKTTLDESAPAPSGGGSVRDMGGQLNESEGASMEDFDAGFGAQKES